MVEKNCARYEHHPFLEIFGQENAIYDIELGPDTLDTFFKKVNYTTS
jgi:hypothetical protein